MVTVGFPSDRDTVYSIQALRGVAVVLVVLFHVTHLR
jgi:peptidoglycan/LPS O-acetylase OafA/YrhL